MKRLNMIMAIVVVMVLSLSSVAAAQEKPAFKLGFKALADQVPEVVGEPLENEHWGANGDSLQRTTTGLMVWRKADNWTAFTNGSRTWINGPNGVEERGNEERFPWEAAAPPAPEPAPVETAPVQPAPVPAQAPPPPPAPAAAPAAPARASLNINIDRPTEGHKIYGDSYTVQGWVVDAAAEGQEWNGIDEFQVWVDGPKDAGGKRLEVTATNRLARQDVAQATGKPAYANSGFRVTVKFSAAGLGNHALYFYAHSAKSGWDYRMINITVKPGLESLIIQDSDLPPGYTLLDSGWDGATYYKAYQTTLPNGPAVVYAELTPFTTEAGARSAVERAEAGLPAIPVRVMHSSASKGVEAAAPTRSGMPWFGIKEVVFSVGNVFGMVWVGGNANMSLVSQSAGVADRMASRIAGAPVPAGPGFQMISR